MFSPVTGAPHSCRHPALVAGSWPHRHMAALTALPGDMQGQTLQGPNIDHVKSKLRVTRVSIDTTVMTLCDVIKKYFMVPR